MIRKQMPFGTPADCSRYNGGLGTPESIRLAFVLCSAPSSPLPSTRISVLNMFPYLRAAGFDPFVVFAPSGPTETPDVSGIAGTIAQSGASIAYFQKVGGSSVISEALALRQQGIATVFGVCDQVDNEMSRITDVTVAVTDHLRSLYAADLQEKICVVHDGIEHPEIQKTVELPSSNDRRRSSKLRAVLVTSANVTEIPAVERIPRFLDVTVVGHYPPATSLTGRLRQTVARVLKGSRSTFTPISTRRFRAMNWTPSGVYQQLLSADLGIIPVDTRPTDSGRSPEPYWRVKSENRLTLCMSIGLPVIATPIPSYLPIIENGKNGFLASTGEQWQECFEALRDPGLRVQIGVNARDSVLLRYSKEEQARLLIVALNKALGRVNLGPPKGTQFA